MGATASEAVKLISAMRNDKLAHPLCTLKEGEGYEQDQGEKIDDEAHDRDT